MISIKIIRLESSFYAFVVVGTVGFVVDAAILSGLIYLYELNPYQARVISYIIALLVTWSLNSKWTFRNRVARKTHHEFYLYSAIQTIGVAINYGVYVWIISIFSWLFFNPVFALAVGSVVAMGFNYLTLRYIVFKPG